MAIRQNDNEKPKLKRKEYRKELRRLQAELCKLQEWVKFKGFRIMIVLEGRDAAGKGGTIKAITERVSPRVFRVVALSVPSNREKSQLYIHDKRRARLNCISHLLSLIPYETVSRKKVKLLERIETGAYDDRVTLSGRSFVPEKY